MAICCCAEPGDGAKHVFERKQLSPIADRRCHDICWLFLYILAAVGSGALCAYAYENADLDIVHYGISSSSGLCHTGNNTGFDYLMYCINGTATDGVVKICGDRCPQTGGDVRNIYLAKKDEFLLATARSADFWERNDYLNLRTLCMAPSFSILHRCVFDLSYITSGEQENNIQPASGVTLPLLYNESQGTEGGAGDELSTGLMSLMTGFSDLAETWHVVVVCGVVGGLVVSFLYLQSLKYFALQITYFSMFLSLVALVAIDLYLAGKAGWVSDDWQDYRDGNYGNVDNAQLEYEYREYFEVATIIALAGTGIMVLILLAMWRSIKLAVALVKEAADCIKSIPFLILLPVLPCIFIFALFVYFAVLAVYIVANGEVVEDRIHYEKEVQYAFIYHCFFALWSFFFIQAMHSMTMAGTVCTYYWTRDKHTMRNPITRSMTRTLVYHAGTAAFGSLVLTIVRLVKWWLTYVVEKMKRAGGFGDSNNKLVKLATCCFYCLIQCVERFIQFVTKNAYILVAVDGRGFCYACGQAWNLIVSNARRMTAVNVVSTYLFFIAKIAVSSACAIGAGAWIQRDIDDLEVTSTFVPTVCTFCLAYFISWLFYEVVDFAVDTLLVCFCLDDMKNKSTGNYYASKRLIKYMAKAQIKKQNRTGPKREGSRVGQF